MIKASKVLKSVKKVAKKHPRWVQFKCQYFYQDGQPCCIVGYGLRKQDIDVRQFLEDNDLNEGTNVSDLLEECAHSLGIDNDLSFKEMRELRTIQMAADAQFPWGETIKKKKVKKFAQLLA